MPGVDFQTVRSVVSMKQVLDLGSIDGSRSIAQRNREEEPVFLYTIPSRCIFLALHPLNLPLQFAPPFLGLGELSRQSCKLVV